VELGRGADQLIGLPPVIPRISPVVQVASSLALAGETDDRSVVLLAWPQGEDDQRDADDDE
jgi:hypothetical protein